MALRPIDVQNKEFKRELLGFKRGEVIEFLQEVSKTLEQLYDQIDLARKEIEELKGKITELETVKERAMREAQIEATRIKDEAKTVALELIEQTRREIARQEREFELLMSQKKDELFALDNLKAKFLRRLREFLDNGKKIIEFFEGEYESRELARLSASMSEKVAPFEQVLEDFVARNSMFKLSRKERGKND